MSRIKGTISVFVLILTCCQGFDLTLNHFASDEQTQSGTRQACAVLRCTETLADVDISRDQGNHSRQLSSLRVYKASVGGDGTRGRWQEVASLTAREPSLDQVSDGMKLSGQLGDHQATVSLELVKTRDCLESQFSCVAVSVDSQGRSSGKNSLVGKGLDSQTHFDPQLQTSNVAVPSRKSGSTETASGGSAAVWTQFLDLKIDLIQSRLGDSLKDLENRLEDKLGEMRTLLDRKFVELDRSIEAKFAPLDLKVTSLQNRLEDKLARIDRRVIEGQGQRKSTSSVDPQVCEGLASKLDRVEVKQTDNRKQLDACVAEVTKLCGADKNDTEILSSGMTSLIESLKLVEENMSRFDSHLAELDTTTGQCTQAITGQNNLLTSLVSSAADQTHNTNRLMSSVKAFRKDYASGALVSVDEYFDLLGTGKKEWRLAFRGTPYIDIKVYPAYIHGTGIPAEVEAGCKQFNQSLPCTNHYRNKEAFDNWAAIDEVFFAVYKGGNLVHRVIFNGKGSSFTNWFSADRIVDSSWADLASAKHGVFSMAGEVTTAVQRRFFMHYDYERGCAGFRGWFYAGDLHGGCPCDQTLGVPMFRYTTGNTLAAYSSTGSAQADAIGVFLKYE